MIYLTCPVRLVRCDAATLDDVLAVLDELDWDDPGGARVYYERLPVGSGVAGGSGGGVVEDGVWMHPDADRWRVVDEDVSLATALRDVVLGRRATVPAQPYRARSGTARSQLPRSAGDASPGVLRRPDGDERLG